MATAPVFAITPRLAVAAVSAANTARDGTGTIVDVLTGVAAGTRIERIWIQTTGDPADSVVTHPAGWSLSLLPNTRFPGSNRLHKCC